MATIEVINILKKYVALLNSEGISVHRAYLYGSYSTNSASDSSDIDVLIVSANPEDPDDRITGKAWKLTRNINSRIEPLIIGQNKFDNDTNSPLLSLIKSKGISII